MMVATSVCLSIAILVAASVQAADEWSYDNQLPNGPDHWSELYPTCGAQSQSPVNLNTASATTFYPPDFVFTNYDRVAAYTLKNNGHSAQVLTNVKDITVTGGGLNGTYVLEQFHFHWGSTSKAGSEHLVNSVYHSFETHFVHYNSDLYSDVASAVASGDPQALAVLGVFADDFGNFGSAELSLIADALVDVPYKGDVTPLSPFAIYNLLPRTSLGDFFRYSGSLTTPSCAEVVVWTVFRRNVFIASDKLGLFRKKLSNAADEPNEVLEYNYRPAQLLNGRVVSRSTKGATK